MLYIIAPTGTCRPLTELPSKEWTTLTELAVTKDRHIIVQKEIIRNFVMQCGKSSSGLAKKCSFGSPKNPYFIFWDFLGQPKFEYSHIMHSIWSGSKTRQKKGSCLTSSYRVVKVRHLKQENWSFFRKHS